MNTRWLEVIVTFVAAASSFEGVLSKPSTDVQDCPMIADIVLVIDISNAITEASGKQENWNYVLDFASSVVGSFPIAPQQTHVGVAVPSSRTVEGFKLDKYTERNALLNEINKLKPFDTKPNIVAGLFFARTKLFSTDMGARNNVAKIAILMTGGLATKDTEELIYEAKLMKDAGIQVFTVGMTDKVDSNLLAAMSSIPTATHSFHVSDFIMLGMISGDLIRGVCDSLSIVETQSTTRATTTTSTTTRKITGQVDGTCSNLPLDLVLIIDELSTRSANWEDDWSHIVGFAKSIVDAFTISPSMTRVSVVVFSDLATIEFYLKASSDATSVKKVIDRLTVTDGKRNIASGIKKARTDAYSPSNGARTGVARKAFIITGGAASIDIAQTIPEADLAKQAGIELFAIGITKQVDDQQLKSICSAPSASHYFYVPDYSQLSTIVKRLVKSACDGN